MENSSLKWITGRINFSDPVRITIECSIFFFRLSTLGWLESLVWWCSRIYKARVCVGQVSALGGTFASSGRSSEVKAAAFLPDLDLTSFVTRRGGKARGIA